MKLLVTDARDNDLLKARMAVRPDHPRALLTLLEGVALWSGQPIRAAIYVAGPVEHSLGLGEFDDQWPRESALVRLDFAAPRRRRRISGLGDFRQLRLLGDESEGGRP
jgi:hypothetical protein